MKKKGYRFKIQLIGDGPNLEKIKKQVEDENLNDFVEILGLKKIHILILKIVITLFLQVIVKDMVLL